MNLAVIFIFFGGGVSISCVTPGTKPSAFLLFKKKERCFSVSLIRREGERERDLEVNNRQRKMQA